MQNARKIENNRQNGMKQKTQEGKKPPKQN